MIRRILSARLTLVLIVAIVPAIILGVFIGALAAASAGTARVPAALVNEDDLVQTKNEDGTTTTIAAGRLVVTGLTKPAQAGTAGVAVDWTLTNAKDARAMLDGGEVYAIVTIPKTFSKSISNLSGTDAKRADIAIRTDDAHGTLVSQISGILGTTIASTIGTSISTSVVQGLYGGYATVRTSLQKAADGATKLSDGASTLSTGLSAAADGGDGVATGVTSLGSGAAKLASGANSLASGLDEAARGAKGAAGGARSLASGVDTYTDGVASYSKGVDSLLTGIAPALDGSISSAQTKLASGSGSIADALTRLAQDPTLSATDAATLASLGTQLQQVSAGQAQLAAGQQRLEAAGAGIAPLESAGAKLRSGGSTLDSGAKALASGLRALPSGLSASAAGARSIGSGAAKLSTGADTLATGASQLADGVRKSASGAKSLATGANTFGSGLGDGAKQVPNLTAAQQKRVGAVVASPIGANASTQNRLSGPGEIVATLILPVGLWIGAAALVLLFGPIRRRLLTTAVGTGRLVGGTLGRGAVVAAAQAVLMVALLAATVHPSWNALLLVFAVAVVAGVAFLAVHQALQAIFGRAGTVLSVVLLGVQLVAVGGIYPIELVSTPFQVVSPFLPMTAGVGATQAALAGAGGSAVAGGLVALALWGLIGFLVTVVAVSRRRSSTALFSPAAAPALS